MSIPFAPTFEHLLKNELARRQHENPKYSLRAFARTLKIEPSLLSKILTGKRTVTLLMLQRLSKIIKISAEETARYQRSIVKQNQLKAKPIRTRVEIAKVSPHHFSPISQWYYPAILEASAMKGFEPTSHWIAKNLNIELAEAQKALVALEALEFFKRNEVGDLTVNSKFNSVLPAPNTTQELMQIQKQFLNKALVAIDAVPLQYRDHSALVMAIPTDRLPQAKAELKKFRRKLMALLQRPGDKNAVYQLAISLSPLTPVSSLQPEKESS